MGAAPPIPRAMADITNQPQFSFLLSLRTLFMQQPWQPDQVTGPKRKLVCHLNLIHYSSGPFQNIPPSGHPIPWEELRALRGSLPDDLWR